MGHKTHFSQITELQWQLEAQTTKSSILQSRLTSALDLMDSLKLDHDRELLAERQAKDNAREKLHRFMEYASSIEHERDECRDALLTVVQKGGHTLYPISCIKISVLYIRMLTYV
jgi:regulator of replication initiation timing